MTDGLFDCLRKDFPQEAERTKTIKLISGYELEISLDDGTKMLYNNAIRAIRRLPKDSTDLTEDECRREFGKRLNSLMWRKGLTQEDLSEITGISQPTLSSYMNGKSSPSFYNTDKIAKALDCSMDDLRYF